MSGLSRMTELQNAATFLLVAATVAGCLGVYFFLSAYGGAAAVLSRWKNRQKIRMAAPDPDMGAKDSEPGLDAPLIVLSEDMLNDGVDHPLESEAEAAQDPEGSIGEIEADEEDVDDPTGVLSTRQRETVFTITRKITITHEEGAEETVRKE